MNARLSRMVGFAAVGGTLLLAACANVPMMPGAGLLAAGNPSPSAGGSASQRANAAADAAAYRPTDYVNAARKGPQVIVLPGQVKSNNATFVQRFGPNNIADYAELELGRANFTVLERSNLGPLLHEAELAYNLGDPAAARRVFQRGRLQTTKWVIKFDVLKAEPVSQASQGFDGRVVGGLLQSMGGGALGTVAGSIRSGESAGVWLIGMRYKVIDANTTEQKATGYFEEKMEIGSTGLSVLGVSNGARGGLTLDTLVQRLVQENVAEIDQKYK